MRTKIDTGSSMCAITHQARVAALELVKFEEYRTGSRMVAYKNVGSKVGSSGAWIRKFIKGYSEMVPSLPVGMNILSLYSRTCHRINVSASNMERMHEIAESLREVASGMARAEAGE